MAGAAVRQLEESGQGEIDVGTIVNLAGYSVHGIVQIVEHLSEILGEQMDFSGRAAPMVFSSSLAKLKSLVAELGDACEEKRKSIVSIYEALEEATRSRLTNR